jgi:hypothetical protein
VLNELLRIQFSNSGVVRRHKFAISPRLAREFCFDVLPFRRSEGAGNAGRPLRPQPRVQCKKAHELVTTVTPEKPGIPYAMVLTVSFVLSPVIGLSCHRRLRKCIPQT